MLKVLLSLKNPSKDILSVLSDHKIENLSDSSQLVKAVSDSCYNLVFLDWGVDILSSIKAADPRVEIIILGDNNIDPVEAVKLGASAYFSYPVDFNALRETVNTIEDMFGMRLETAKLERLLNSKYTFAGLVGRNPEMLEIFSFVRRIAPYYKTVTVMGETGTGKELIAKAIHSLSPVSKGPFVVCNCGGLVEGLVESEFFGYVKGSFTGAVKDKAGLFEAANEGTIFLDEIGELPLSFQPSLLRVLQDGEVRRIGSNRSFKTTCRVIAATNTDLSEELKNGRFREDLYYRLTPLTINAPPLRERKDDIQLLCRFLIDKFSRRTGKKVFGISRPAQIVLMSHNWPGNIRELENVVEQAAMLTPESFIRLNDLPPYMREIKHGPPSIQQTSSTSFDEVVKKHITMVLQQCEGNKTRTAQMLGLSRRALSRKMEKYGI
jgi:DNA-binding NtrC family response regulator